MIIYHATPNWNAPGCIGQGILCCRAAGKRKVVWLHTAGFTYWAVHHVAYRHGCTPQQVIVLRVSLPRRRLRRGPIRGLWYCIGDVTPERILVKKVSGRRPGK